MQGGEIGRDIHGFRDLLAAPSEATIDAKAKTMVLIHINLHEENKEKSYDRKRKLSA